MLTVVDQHPDALSFSSSGSPVGPSNSARTASPTLSVYAAYMSTAAHNATAKPIRIMRVHATPIALPHGDVLACSPEHQLIAVSSNTSNQVLIYDYHEEEEQDEQEDHRQEQTQKQKNMNTKGLVLALKETLLVNLPTPSIESTGSQKHDSPRPTTAVSTTCNKQLFCR